MDEHSYHYGVMKRAMARIDTAAEGLTLDALARDMGMSPAHFQRTFSQWVGVSPKRYHQYLNLGHAKTLLRDHFTTLETSHALGLSGSGRLHDLFVKWEGMSPGKFAARGAGLTVHYGWYPSPFGEMLVMATEAGICGIAFVDELGRERALADMAARWPEATLHPDQSRINPYAESIFSDKETQIAPLGAPFQIKVWEALLSIPSGHVTTYGAIAAKIGNPKAVRAVGTAVGRNPIGWLIPCHRVIRKSGDLGGYHWGTTTKRSLLAWESAQRDAHAAV